MATRAARAESLPARQRPRPRPEPRAVRRPTPRTRVIGVAWIAALTVLLAGVVAMNVAVLRLNITLDRLGRQRGDLRVGNAALSSRLSSSAAALRIQSLAAKRLGLVPADSDQTSYVELAP